MSVVCSTATEVTRRGVEVQQGVEPERVARSNAEDAYQAIRRLILTVQMPPGSSFTEQELVRQVGFGKTPVREALLRLKLERLVAVQARSGYRVAPVTLKNVRDTCGLLANLEAAAMESASGLQARSSRLDPLEAQVQQGMSSDEAGLTGDGWIRADWQFHLALARAQDNALQADVMTQLSQGVLRFRNLAVALGVPSRMLSHDHADLLRAVAQGDTAGAVVATARMWRETEDGLVTLLSGTEPVLTMNVWAARDSNAFYLDAAAGGTDIADVFEQPTRSPRAGSAPTADQPRTR
jgi:DNA-binding GntR family transcriptional regulator